MSLPTNLFPLPILALMGMLAQAAPHPGRPHPGAAIPPAITFPFIRNDGQIDPAVGYYARTPHGNVFVTHRGEIIYTLPVRTVDRHSPLTGSTAVVLREQLSGSGARPTPTGSRPSRVHVSEFHGQDPSRWRGPLATFEQLDLGTPHPGLRVALLAKTEGIEKRFTLDRGRSAEHIRLDLAGARALALTPDGELSVETPGGPIRFRRPVAWQDIQGERHPVRVAYRLIRTRSSGKADDPVAYGFRIGSHHDGHPVVIDPVLASTFLGGSQQETATAMALDATGNVYLAGVTLSNDFPATPGAYSLVKANNPDAFVAKLSPDLTTLLAATYLGGSSGQSYAQAITADNTGDVLIAGYTEAANFPVTGGYDITHNGARDVFVCRLNSTLTTLIASTFIGGDGNDFLYAMRQDAGGALFLVGDTNSSAAQPFPATIGAYDTIPGGTSDGFVLSLDESLSLPPSAATLLGDTGEDTVRAIIFDGASVFVAGDTTSTGFPTAGSPYDNTHSGAGRDMFVARLPANLSSLSSSTFIGGAGNDATSALARNASTGDVYVVGQSDAAGFPTVVGGAQTTHGGNSDGVIVRLTSSLGALLSSTYLGGSGTDLLKAIIVESGGDILVTGESGSSNFPATTGALDTTLGGSLDAVITRLDSNLSQIKASSYLGGTGTDRAYVLATGGDGSIYIAGDTGSTDFPVSAGAAQTLLKGSSSFDSFVTRVSPDLLAPIYTLTVQVTGTGAGNVTSAPAGINCGADCTENVSSSTSVTLTATASGDSAFTGWDGGGCSGRGTCTLSLSAATTVTANFNEIGCFIATAAFGSPLHPHVASLRAFRDRTLLESDTGRALVAFYYLHSPAMARVISAHETLRAITRLALIPVILAVEYPVSTATGIFVLFAVPVVGPWLRRRRAASASTSAASTTASGHPT